jgi:hypothetical protein
MWPVLFTALVCHGALNRSCVRRIAVVPSLKSSHQHEDTPAYLYRVSTPSAGDMMVNLANETLFRQ